MLNIHDNASSVKKAERPQLRRRLTLPLLILYGLGVTIGAGIYVLVGATASKAGIYAPISFLIAASVVAFTGFSYAELGTRYPVSAGEAAYVSKGFNSKHLPLITGLFVIVSGVISSATVAIGAAGYLQTLVSISTDYLITLIVIIIGIIAIWGILESVILAAIFTVLEIGGLSLVIWIGATSNPDLVNKIPSLLPPFELAVWSGILSAGLLAFFAFIGFEDIANVAEEVKNPRRTLPLGIIITLVIATIIYFVVVSIVVLTIPIDILTHSDAPLTLIFVNTSQNTRNIFNVVAIIATINGALIQVIMASRVLYGLASQNSLPEFLSYVHPITRTPITATFVVISLIIILALFFPIAELAEATSQVVLVVFALVNMALILIKRQEKPSSSPTYFQVPGWVPFLGFISSSLLFLASFIQA
ncbi:MAG: amino acid permease [Halopseudomonas aestusnigri]